MSFGFSRFAVRREYWLQVFFLSLVTLASTFPKLWGAGTNVVTNTYVQASARLWSGQIPYGTALPGGDLYKYSPFFGFLYGPFTLLSPQTHALLWGLLNMFVFWMGVSCWYQFQKNQSKWLWLALIACTMELNGPILYQQINALLIGLTLIAVAFYRDRRFFSSGLVLALVTNFKILPIVFLLSLSINLNLKYLKGLTVGTLMALIIPALLSGFSHAWDLHQSWFSVLFADVNNRGLLDIATVLDVIGFPESGKIIRILILYLSLVIMVLTVLRLERRPWRLWITVGTSCLLLVSPRTESPTFVLIAPSYLFLMTEILKYQNLKLRRLFQGLFLLGIFFITLSYNDVWPKWVWNPHENSNVCKTFGTLILWLMSAGILWQWWIRGSRIVNRFKLLFSQEFSALQENRY